MLNNEEIVSFPHYLVVNHYNANDFELREDFHCSLIIVISSISYFIHSYKVSGQNIKCLYGKVIINEQTMTISPLH